MGDTEHALYVMKADLIKALAHSTRLAIIDCLGRGEACVSGIAEALGVERSSISQHLAILTNAGILDRRKDGLTVCYRLHQPLPWLHEFLACALKRPSR